MRFLKNQQTTPKPFSSLAKTIPFSENRQEKFLPALKRTMAFRQANSAGSTPTDRYLSRTSLRTRTSAAIWLALPLGLMLRCSVTLNRGLVSNGRHHCTAFRRNSSDQHSSRRITWTEERVEKDSGLRMIARCSILYFDAVGSFSKTRFRSLQVPEVGAIMENPSVSSMQLTESNV